MSGSICTGAGCSKAFRCGRSRWCAAKRYAPEVQPTSGVFLSALGGDLAEQLAPGGAEVHHVAAADDQVATGLHRGGKQRSGQGEDAGQFAGGFGLGHAGEHGFAQFRVGYLTGPAHADGEVARAHKDAGEAVDGEYLVDMGNCFGGFDLCEEVGAGVGAGEYVCEVVHTETHAAGAGVKAAVADRRVFAGVDDAARVVGVVDHRHEDDSGADFERAQDVVALAIGQADQGEDAASLGGEA